MPKRRPDQGTLFHDQRPGAKRKAPETLTTHERLALDEWAERTVPWLSRGAFDSLTTLPQYVEEVLEYWQANGRTKANWLATIKNRVRTVERERLAKLAQRGNAQAARALRDPAGWALLFDSAQRVKPAATAEAAELIRPRGGKVIALRSERA